MEFLTLFLTQHALGHAREVGEGATPFSIGDAVLSGLDEAHLRSRPRPGLNSLVWIYWHMARTEDATMNLIVAGPGCSAAPAGGPGARCEMRGS